MDIDTTPSGLDPIDELVEEYLGRLRRGERPSPADYAARYPEHARRIIELFPALELIEGLKPTAEDESDPPSGSIGQAGRTDRRDQIERLGEYALLRELGRGGMGIVYEAEHESLKNRVALKVMHKRFRSDRAYLQRFQTEARSAAKLHHTNIVSVFDYGEQGGICYYAMQYIDGVGLDQVLRDVRRLRDQTHDDPDSAGVKTIGGTGTEAAWGMVSIVSHGLLTGRFVDAPTANMAAGTAVTALRADDGTTPHWNPGVMAEPDESVAALSSPSGSAGPSFAGQPESVYFREVARLGAQVADALEHAHRHGVIHRDIKPSNLLLDPLGNVWVTDFGLAKLIEADGLSQSHDLVGTMRFMAPERFKGVNGRRGDIYALGATLYELLTLRPAFNAPDQAWLLHQIEHQPPASLRGLDRRIPRDLETVVLKAMSKDPNDRFGAAGELADELRRFLESRPIRSRPSPTHERLWQWCRRNPWLAGANIAAATLTILMAIGATTAALTFYHQKGEIERALIRARDSESEAIQARTASRVQLFEALQARARAGRFSRRIGQRFESLDALSKAVEIGRQLQLPGDTRDSLRAEAIACLALPDMKETGRVILRPPGLLQAAFDPTMTRYAFRFADSVQVRRFADDVEIGRFPARGDRDFFTFGFSPDGRYVMTTHAPGLALTVWDIDRGTVAVDDPEPVMGTSFSHDGRRLALSHPNGEVLIYDLATGRPDRRWSAPAPALELAFRPDGARIAAVHRDQGKAVCSILESESGRVVRSIALPITGSLAWSSDGSTLSTASDDAKIYLWDAATGTRKAVLEGPTNGGLHAAFHPSGTLLASNGWENRLRLWDPVQGRPLLSLSGITLSPALSRDDRIVVSVEDKLTTYQVDPALEYRTLAHFPAEVHGSPRSSIHRDGRLLASTERRGVAIWDLARGVELGFLPLVNVEMALFEPSGDLISNGPSGVFRWPVRLDIDRGEFKIGPPERLSLAGGVGAIAADPTGQALAVPCQDHALVSSPDGLIRIGPLDDCRNLAISTDGKYLATGSHGFSGAQIWRLGDGQRVANLPAQGIVGTVFSPDGKWLMTTPSPCQLWAVGDWTRPTRKIGGNGLCFSPDGRLLVVQDASKVLRLVETESGRTLARLESPDSSAAYWASFSPDGSLLVVNSPDGPAVHVWDLRAIRRQLAVMGLDWDVPALSEADPIPPSAPTLPPLQFVLKPMKTHTRHGDQPTEVMVDRFTASLKERPDDADAYHQRGHALADSRRSEESLADFNQAIRLRPDDVHLLESRARLLAVLKQYPRAIGDLEAVLRLRPDQPAVRKLLALCHNNQAWDLVNGPPTSRDPGAAILLARRALELDPNEGLYLNTLGVAEYRAGRHVEAIATLERSLAANRGESLAFDLYFLAMAHFRLGHATEARRCHDRAIRWAEDQQDLTPDNARELAEFRVESESVLRGQRDDLPADVFAPRK